VKAAAADAARKTPPQKTQVIAAGRNRVREDKSKSVRPPAAAVATDAASPPAEQRHWPEGASALGALAPTTHRQVWWKMPPSTSSPFSDSTNHP
jgi:hypothetical protein